MKYYSYKDLYVSALGLGCAQFGQEYGIGSRGKILLEKEIQEIIEAALENGVSFFDTAADYGKSEEWIGNILARMHRKDLVVATKLRWVREPEPSVEQVRHTIERSLEDSLRKLRRETLDIVYIHQQELFFQFQEVFLSVLEKARQSGYVKHVGISLYEPRQVEQALLYKELEVFQIPYNVLNRAFEKEGTMKTLKEKGKLVVVRSVFLQGLLLLDPEELIPFFHPIKESLKNLRENVERFFRSPEEFFLGYVLRKDFGPLAVGVFSQEQLMSNLQVFRSLPGADLLRQMEQFIPHLDPLYSDPRKWPK